MRVSCSKRRRARTCRSRYCPRSQRAWMRSSRRGTAQRTGPSSPTTPLQAECLLDVGDRAARVERLRLLGGDERAGLHAVDVERAVQVIDLVLEDAGGPA